MRRTSGGADRPAAADPCRCTGAGCDSSGGTADAETVVTARRPASRPSARRNGATVRTASHAGPATGVSSAMVFWAMASAQFMVSDDVSHQAKHSALTTGSPVSVRTTRNAVMEAIAVLMALRQPRCQRAGRQNRLLKHRIVPRFVSSGGFSPERRNFSGAALFAGAVAAAAAAGATVTAIRGLLRHANLLDG